MVQYLEVIQKSKNIPRNVDFTNLSDAKLQPVSPDGFDILDEEAEAGKIDKDLLVFAKELYLKEEN